MTKPIAGPDTQYELEDGGYQTIPENSGIRRFVWEHFTNVNRIGKEEVENRVTNPCQQLNIVQLQVPIGRGLKRSPSYRDSGRPYSKSITTAKHSEVLDGMLPKKPRTYSHDRPRGLQPPPPYVGRHVNIQLFTNSNLERAQEVIDLTGDFDLETAFLQGIPTLEHMRSMNLSRPDNVFISRRLRERLIVVVHEARPEHTDHFPIRTVVGISTSRAQWESRNLKKADWEEFRETMKTKLPRWEDPPSPRNQEEFEALRGHLTRALRETKEIHTLLTRFTHFSHRWWTKELKVQRKVVRWFIPGKREYGGSSTCPIPQS
jgi:hypothetical protein